MQKIMLKKNKYSFLNKIDGFSLIEIAIVASMVAMVSGALLVFGGNKITQAQIELTKQRMDIIERAIQEFAYTYGYLPCPADITLQSQTSGVKNPAFGVGVASGSGDCKDSGALEYLSASVYAGMVPYRTLDSSLDAAVTVDAWGNRILYVVDDVYTSTSGYGTLDATSSDASMEIYAAHTPTTTPVVIAGGKLAYILISYGPNGYYGRANKNPATINPSSSEVREIENGDANDSLFYTSLTDKNFDDIVRYKTRWQLEK